MVTLGPASCLPALASLGSGLNAAAALPHPHACPGEPEARPPEDSAATEGRTGSIRTLRRVGGGRGELWWPGHFRARQRRGASRAGVQGGFRRNFFSTYLSLIQASLSCLDRGGHEATLRAGACCPLHAAPTSPGAAGCGLPAAWPLTLGLVDLVHSAVSQLTHQLVGDRVCGPQPRLQTPPGLSPSLQTPQPADTPRPQLCSQTP